MWNFEHYFAAGGQGEDRTHGFKKLSPTYNTYVEVIQFLCMMINFTHSSLHANKFDCDLIL